MAGVKNMRTGGQNRKTTALHVLQGTFKKSRHGHQAPGVLPPPTGAPEAPGPLAGEAQAEWDRMIVRLEAAGTLSTVDGSALWCYVRLWADCCRLQAHADTLQMADPKAIPALQALKQYRLAMRTYFVEFGLTPLARNRVAAPAPTEQAPTMDPRKAAYLASLKTS